MVRKLAAVVIVAVALALAACTSSPTVTPTTTVPTTTTRPLNGNVTSVPAVDIPATPTGWIPIDFRDAQISVPATWWYQSPAEDSCPGSRIPGLVFVGAVHNVCAHPPATASFASIASAGVVEIGHPRQKETVVNGIPVYIEAGGLTYYVPLLDVQVHASGPLARRVLHTLTWSPNAAVLAREPTPRVPTSWTWYNFAGLRFAAPRSWPHRTTDDILLGCPQVVPELRAMVVFDTATTASAPGCILVPTEVSFIHYSDGLVVASGPDQSVQLPKSLRYCLNLHGLRGCLTSVDVNYGGVFELIVAVPGRSRPTLVEIGLAGNGMVARTILYSLRAA
jgi:hypothetical protein